MGSIKSFTELEAWKEGHQLILHVYSTTRGFPSNEKFALTDQIRRAATSITNNIAEGFSRYNAKEKRQFYRTALGSLTELQNQLLISRDLEYVSSNEFQNLNDRSIVVSKLLNGLIKSATLNT